MSDARSAANRRYYVKNRDKIRAAFRERYRAKLGGMTKRERKRDAASTPR